VSYPIFDIEISQPLPTLTISRGDTGIAVLVRRKGKPLAFWMEPLPANTSLTPEQLASRISENTKAQVLRESIREELIPMVKWLRFPSLTVAICTKDHPALLARCIDSLLALERDVSGVPISLEILVVDNAPSDDETRELVASWSEVRYICEPRPGLNFARNHAILAAKGELLAFMDDDVIVDSGWLRGLMEAWIENPDAAAFTGLVLPYELQTEAQIIFAERGGFRRGFNKIRYGQSLPGNPEYPCGAGIFGVGANMAFQRCILDKLGGFDEALDTGAPLPGGGDLDMFYRVMRAGYEHIYEPRALVRHRHRRTQSEVQAQLARNYR